MRSLCLGLLPLCLVACGQDKGGGGSDGADGADGAHDSPPAWCEGSTGHQWSPKTATELELFPDGLLEIADPASPTGRRLRVDEDTVPWLAGTPALLKSAVEGLGDLSGFGTLGGMLLRFDAPVTAAPTTAEASVSDPGWMLVDLSGASPERVPFEARILEDGLTVVIWPLRPLRLGSPHALVLTTDAPAADGGCIAPAPTTRDLLHGEPEDPTVAEAAPRYRAAVEALGLIPDDISVLTVFTTHDDLGPMKQLSAEVPEHPVAWAGPGACSPRGNLIQCELETTVLDHRNALGLVDASVTPTEGPIPVTVWLPSLDGGPYPIVLYGHGLGSSRGEGYRVAENILAAGVAVVAMEAVEHGDHPGASGDGADDALRFLGIDMATLSIQPRMIRGNFDQTNLDRLRLLRLLKQSPDLDGDGNADLDVDQVGYLGVSLGAILGPQLLALTDEVAGGVLSVGGGRLMTIVTDTDGLSQYEDLIIALVGSRALFDRLVPVAQHLVDPSDPAVWGAHVLTDRFDDAPAPSVLLQVAMDDEVVPRTSGFALAQAMDLPHMAPVALEIPLLQITEADPVVGNIDGGNATAAFFQFDRVTIGGSVGPAYHVDTPTSDEGKLQMLWFLQTWLEEGRPEVINPYAVLDTPARGG